MSVSVRASARVRLTVDVGVSGVWGGDGSVEQVRMQASLAAEQVVRNQFKGALRVNVEVVDIAIQVEGRP